MGGTFLADEGLDVDALGVVCPDSGVGVIGRVDSSVVSLITLMVKVFNGVSVVSSVVSGSASPSGPILFNGVLAFERSLKDKVIALVVLETLLCFE